MTHHVDHTLLDAVCELLEAYGFDGLAEATTIVLNEAMKVERSRHLQAAPYERPPHCAGVDAQLAGDVLLVDTTLFQCFNHGKVLLAEHRYLLSFA